jgi:hypothetical protein
MPVPKDESCTRKQSARGQNVQDTLRVQERLHRQDVSEARRYVENDGSRRV